MHNTAHRAEREKKMAEQRNERERRKQKWKRKSERGMISEWKRKTSRIRYGLSTCAGYGGLIMDSVREERGRRWRPDVSHTLHMWLWLTFHLPAWPPASHPSLASHLPVRMSAVFLDTASAARKRLRFPVPWQFAACCFRWSVSGRTEPAHLLFRAYLEKSGTDHVLPRAPDGDDASAHQRDQILRTETVLFWNITTLQE